MLLLPDNFEHLLTPSPALNLSDPTPTPAVPLPGGGSRGGGGATGLLLDTLRGAPGVKLLVTSRERLNLQWEWLFEIEGLPYPDFGFRILRQAQDGVSDFELKSETLSSDNTQYAAVQLFLERARRVRWGFALGEEDIPWVVRICQLVEGLPLGIELAAASGRGLSYREIAAGIERNLDILATSLRDVPARHRSLRAVFDH